MDKLYIGNLSGQITDSGLEAIFSGKGFQVTSARVICDREGGRSRGFGFVELGSSEAARAVTEMNGFDVDGRALQVIESHWQDPRSGGCRTGRVYSGARPGSNSRRNY
jgi:RNA recognition motif-containing protein